MHELTIGQVREKKWLILEVVTGSRAYGLDTAESDTDLRGVFILPKERLYGLDYVAQVSNESNDIVFYELGRFMELLGRNNPNILETLYTPEACILKKHPVMTRLEPAKFLSRLCEQTFANYAYTQIKKAFGLEKKILNPVEKERKYILDFCFVYDQGKTSPLTVFLEANGLNENQIGLAAVPYLRDTYNMYYGSPGEYEGVMRKSDSNDVCASHIPKGKDIVALLYFNKDGYSVYCKKYKEYWDWVEKRNEERYKTTVKHGKNYDSKNMMHVFRLLLMAREIATERTIHVRRKDRDFLLAVKRGEFSYDDLVQRAEALRAELPGLYEKSNLPERPDPDHINALLVECRKEYYKE